eukprot:3688932-Rhodomonas_salina.1
MHAAGPTARPDHMLDERGQHERIGDARLVVADKQHGNAAANSQVLVVDEDRRDPEGWGSCAWSRMQLTTACIGPARKGG